MQTGGLPMNDEPPQRAKRKPWDPNVFRPPIQRGDTSVARLPTKPPDAPKPKEPLSAPSEPERRALLQRALLALTNLLPIGFSSLLPEFSEVQPIKMHDFSRLVVRINLPNFTKGNTSPIWPKLFAKPVAPQLRQTFANQLAQAIEAGAEPQNRLSDIHHAWWELAFMGSQSESSNPAKPDDLTLLLADEEIARWTGDHDIQRALSRFRSSNISTESNGWNQRSLLSILGYAVGTSGRPANVRRVALQACLLLPDHALPIEQREFWGPRASRRRGRAVARMIRLFVSLAENRTHGDWTKACADWNSDLRWLASEFQITVGQGL